MDVPWVSLWVALVVNIGRPWREDEVAIRSLYVVIRVAIRRFTGRYTSLYVAIRRKFKSLYVAIRRYTKRSMVTLLRPRIAT